MRNSLFQPYQQARNSVYASDISESYQSPLRRSDFRHLSFCPTTDVYLPPMRSVSLGHKFKGVLRYEAHNKSESEEEASSETKSVHRSYSVKKLINHYLGKGTALDNSSILSFSNRASSLQTRPRKPLEMIKIKSPSVYYRPQRDIYDIIARLTRSSSRVQKILDENQREEERRRLSRPRGTPVQAPHDKFAVPEQLKQMFDIPLRQKEILRGEYK